MSGQFNKGNFEQNPSNLKKKARISFMALFPAPQKTPLPLRVGSYTYPYHLSIFFISSIIPKKIDKTHHLLYI